MRIPYATLDGFKSKADHLRDLLGIESTSASQEALAQLSGYKNYQKVLSDADLGSGTAKANEDVILRLLALFPRLTPTGASNILAQLKLFCDAAPALGRPAEGGRLGQPEVVTPSTMAHFLNKDFAGLSGFSTPKFAAYFAMTVEEAQQVLNGFADIGWLTYTGAVKGVESWAPSREGMRVFGVGDRAKRLSKKDLTVIEKGLEAVGPKLAKHGVLELSVAGRPAFGLQGGTLIVGARLKHTPFSLESDAKILFELYSVLRKAVIGDYFSVLLFEERFVPERLGERRAIFGENAGQALVTPHEQLDIEETQHWARYNEFAQAYLRRWEDTAGPHWTLSFTVQREQSLSKIPLKCIRSDFKYPTDTNEFLDTLAVAEAEWVAYRRDGLQGWRAPFSAELLADADYAIATNSLETFAALVSRGEHRGFMGWSPPTCEMLTIDLGVALLLRSDAWAIKRAARTDAKKTPRRDAVRYYALFDGLDYEEPVLVGFVRQPNSGDSFRYLEDAYEDLIRQAPSGYGRELLKQGYSAGYLALIRRPATAEEEDAYKAVCKDYDSQFKAILVAHGKFTGYRAHYLRRVAPLGGVPAVLASAKVGAPIKPKLLRDNARDNSNQTLFTLTQSWPLEAQSRAARCFVDVESIRMTDFARRAEQTSADDPLVLGADICAAWRFKPTTKGWVASLESGRWYVSLTSSGKALDISLKWGDSVHTQSMLPEKIDFGHCYNGNLGGLLQFFRDMRNVWSNGVEQCWAVDALEHKLPDTPESRVDWLARVASLCLHGHWQDFDRYDGTAWASIHVPSREELSV